MSRAEEFRDAESQFRAAFERLKCGRPSVLQQGSKVSQNNVAKEAGRDPSALRKSRYPKLIAEIRKWIDEGTKTTERRYSNASLLRGARGKNRELAYRIAELTQQRDSVMGRLVIAEELILELHRRLQEYKRRLGEERTVVPFQGRKG